MTDPAKAWEGLPAPGERIVWQGRPVFIATDICGYRSLEDYVIESDAEIALTQEGDQQTVAFAERWVRGSKGRKQRRIIGFELLPDGREVYGLLRAIRDAARDNETDQFA